MRLAYGLSQGYYQAKEGQKIDDESYKIVYLVKVYRNLFDHERWYVRFKPDAGRQNPEDMLAKSFRIRYRKVFAYWTK